MTARRHAKAVGAAALSVLFSRQSSPGLRLILRHQILLPLSFCGPSQREDTFGTCGAEVYFSDCGPTLGVFTNPGLREESGDQMLRFRGRSGASRARAREAQMTGTAFA